MLAVAFFCNSIALAYISGQSVDRESVTERFGVSGEAPLSSEPVPKAGEFVTDVPDLPAADGSQSPEGSSDVPDAPDSTGEQTTQ